MSREELFEKYYLGTLSEGEIAEMKRLLRGDAAARAEFAHFTEERSLLIQVSGRRADAVGGEIPEGTWVEEETVPVRRPSRVLARRPARRSLAAPLIFAAGLLAGIAGVVAFYPREPKPAPAQVKAPPRDSVAAEREVERIDAERRRAFDRVASMEREKQELQAAQKAEEAKDDDRRRAGEELAKVEARLREEAASLARSLELKRKAEEELGRLRPQPARTADPAPATVAAAATVESVQGEVTAAAGRVLLEGQGLETVGASGRATLLFGDGSRVELGPATKIREIRGGRVALDRGTVSATVMKRPADQAMVFATPHGEARVLGTALRVTVGAGTRLEVTEGRVRLTRASDSKSVEVAADHYAVVQAGTELAAKPMLLRRRSEEFETLPAWSSSFDAAWGGAAQWGTGPGASGNALVAGRAGPGSSAQVLVMEIPGGATVDLSALMKVPASRDKYWVEFGYRLGDHRADDFDVNAAEWTLVKKFGPSGFQNGNGNQWARYSAKINTGTATRISVGFKIGATEGSGPAAGWDNLRIQ